MIAEVIVDIAHSEVDKIFEYRAIDGVKAGSRVRAPFGGKVVAGFVMRLKDASDCPPERLKRVFPCPDELPALNGECLALAEKLTARYRVPKALALRLFLPSEMRTGKVRELRRNYAALKVPFSEIKLSKTAKNQLGAAEYLAEHGKTDCGFLNGLFPGGVAALEKKGYVEVTKEQLLRDPYKGLEEEHPDRVLTNEQRSAVERIERDGRTVQLIGTVDRADEWIEDDGTRWVRVVDYKTGTKKLDLREVYCGLDCQMLLYLFSLTRDADGRFTGAEPAGVLYLLADPAPETTTRGKAARSMEYKLDGLVRDEQKVFDAMDAEETGRYLPFSFRGGVPSPYQKEKRADKAKLSRIQLHLDDLVTQMGEQLYSGCIAAEPLVTGRSPCRWCDYGFICCHEEGIGERALDAPAKPFEPEEKKEEDQ